MQTLIEVIAAGYRETKNYYPVGTRIEREFPQNKGVIYDATITDIDLKKNNIN